MAVSAWSVFTVLALLVGLHWSPLLTADHQADTAAHDAVLGDATLRAAARAMTQLGNPLAMDLVALVSGVVLASVRQVAVGVYLVAARAGDVALDSAIKSLVGRPRPQWARPVSHAGGFSFPSGHAAGATAVYGALAVVVVLLLRRRRLVAASAFVLLVLSVAASRVLLGVHYPTDVTAGALLSLGWLGVCTAVLLRHRERSA